MTVPYSVDYRYGIDVNQILLGGVAGKCLGTKCPKHPPVSLGTLDLDWLFVITMSTRMVMLGSPGVEWEMERQLDQAHWYTTIM